MLGWEAKKVIRGGWEPKSDSAAKVRFQPIMRREFYAASNQSSILKAPPPLNLLQFKLQTT
jgi:hypothetical protein